ncbi:internalin [Hexamita inflata]|uniref:Internalin n=1 Tax=Hexamita inflata TaxID=28002 RepID=A0AA86TYB5_9EUKA|nr:internalin [Hexamita inflata]
MKPKTNHGVVDYQHVELFLNVNECKVCNVEPLSKLNELQHVYLRSNRILDVTPINSLENLRYLDIADNCVQNIKDLIIRKQVRYVTSNQSHAKKHELRYFKRTCSIRTCTQMVAKCSSKKYQFIERINLGKRQVSEQQSILLQIKQQQILAWQLLNSMIQSSIYEAQ